MPVNVRCICYTGSIRVFTVWWHGRHSGWSRDSTAVSAGGQQAAEETNPAN